MRDPQSSQLRKNLLLSLWHASDPHQFWSSDSTSFLCGFLHRAIHSTADFFPLERSVEEKQIERKSEGIWDGNQSSCNLGNDIPSPLLHCFYRSPNSRGGDYTWTWVQGGQEHWCHLAIAYPTWHTNVGDRRLSSSCSRPVHIFRNWHSPAAK